MKSKISLVFALAGVILLVLIVIASWIGEPNENGDHNNLPVMCFVVVIGVAILALAVSAELLKKRRKNAPERRSIFYNYITRKKNN